MLKQDFALRVGIPYISCLPIGSIICLSSPLPINHMSLFSRLKRAAAKNDKSPLPSEPSFRVLERSEAAAATNFDGVLLPKALHLASQPAKSHVDIEDNIFADLKSNRLVQPCILSFIVDFYQPLDFENKPKRPGSPDSHQPSKPGRCLSSNSTATPPAINSCAKAQP